MIALLQNSITLTDLVHIVVSMRENRDGLVELPSHFRYLARLASVDIDTQFCPLLFCRLLSSVLNIRDSVFHYQYNSFMTSFCFGIVSCLILLLLIILSVHGYQIALYLLQQHTVIVMSNSSNFKLSDTHELSSTSTESYGTSESKSPASNKEIVSPSRRRGRTPSKQRISNKTTNQAAGNSVSLHYLSQQHQLSQERLHEATEEEVVRASSRYHRIPAE